MPKGENWTPWTEDEVALLRKLVTKGDMSFSMMEKHFPNRSRNTLIGKAHRLGLTSVRNPNRPRGVNARQRPTAVAPVAMQDKPVEDKPKPRFAMLVEEPEPLASPPVVQKEAPPPPPDGGVALQDLREHHCRWPLGETNALPPYKFCGCQKMFGASYCATHLANAYQKRKAGTVGDRKWVRPKVSAFKFRTKA